MSRSEREKGRRAERELLNALRLELGDQFPGLDLNRNQFEAKRWDLEVGPLAIEIKRLREDGGRLLGCWREACRQADDDHTPVLAYRLDLQKWMFRMSLWDVARFVADHQVMEPTSPRPDWVEAPEFTMTMPLEAFCYLVREYIAAPRRGSL